MMGSDFFFRDKIPVGILGATGYVGQKLIQMLSQHPWFEITAVCASERSIGKAYGEAVNWLMPTPIPQHVARMELQLSQTPLPCAILFSALNASVAGEIETYLALAGYVVISNCRNHRMDQHVPLLIGEVNPDHLELVKFQPFGKGMIVTNPNCSATGLTMALKPLWDEIGIEAVQVVTLQAISGAGYPGIASLNILDNVLPFIAGEEEKLESEPLKILGHYKEGSIEAAQFKISAQCNRVSVLDGHTECVSIKLSRKVEEKDLIGMWRTFKGLPQELQLPTAPEHPIHYFDEPFYPQPKLHRELDKGMAVSIGGLRPCSLLDYKFTLLSHNAIRGAAGGALLNAEMLVKKGFIYW